MLQLGVGHKRVEQIRREAHVDAQIAAKAKRKSEPPPQTTALQGVVFYGAEWKLKTIDKVRGGVPKRLPSLPFSPSQYDEVGNSAAPRGERKPSAKLYHETETYKAIHHIKDDDGGKLPRRMSVDRRHTIELTEEEREELAEKANPRFLKKLNRRSTESHRREGSIFQAFSDRRSSIKSSDFGNTGTGTSISSAGRKRALSTIASESSVPTEQISFQSGGAPDEMYNSILKKFVQKYKDRPVNTVYNDKTLNQLKIKVSKEHIYLTPTTSKARGFTMNLSQAEQVGLSENRRKSTWRPRSPKAAAARKQSSIFGKKTDFARRVTQAYKQSIAGLSQLTEEEEEEDQPDADASVRSMKRVSFLRVSDTNKPRASQVYKAAETTPSVSSEVGDKSPRKVLFDRDDEPKTEEELGRAFPIADSSMKLRFEDGIKDHDERMPRDRAPSRLSVQSFPGWKDKLSLQVRVDEGDAPTRALIRLYKKSLNIPVEPSRSTLHSVDVDASLPSVLIRCENIRTTESNYSDFTPCKIRKDTPFHPKPGKAKQIGYNIPRVGKMLRHQGDVKRRILGQASDAAYPEYEPDFEPYTGPALFEDNERAKLVATHHVTKTLRTLQKNVTSKHIKKRLRKLTNQTWTSWAERATRLREIMEAIKNKTEEAEESSDSDDEDFIPPIEIFRKKAWAVAKLAGMCLAIRREAEKKGLVLNFENEKKRKLVDSEGNEKDIYWDVDEFRRPKEPNVPQGIQEILNKNPNDRTESDIHKLMSVMQNIKDFRKYTFDMQANFCRIVKYMRCNAHRVVLRKGQPGHLVYFIFSGTVGVLLNEDDDSIFSKPEMVTLGKGACFGEVALVENKTRTATVICTSNAEFFYIIKEDFQEYKFDEKMEEEYQMRYRYFRSWGALGNWPTEKFQQLATYSQTESYGYSKIVVQNSLENDKLFFILEGQCDLLRYIDPKEAQRIHSLVEHVLEPMRDGYQLSPWTMKEPPKKILHKKFVEKPRVKSSYHLRKERRERRAAERIGTGEVPSDYKVQLGKLKSALEHAYKASNQDVTRLDVFSSASNSTIDTTPDETCDRVSSLSDFYVSVDTLRDGMCFGLDSLQDNPTEQRFSLLSKSCTIIHVKKSQFMELCDNDTLMILKTTLRDFPSDNDIIKGLQKKIRWERYKKNVLCDALKQRLQKEAFLADFMENKPFQLYLNSKVMQDAAHGQMTPSREDLVLNRTIAYRWGSPRGSRSRVNQDEDEEEKPEFRDSGEKLQEYMSAKLVETSKKKPLEPLVFVKRRKTKRIKIARNVNVAKKAPANAQAGIQLPSIRRNKTTVMGSIAGNTLMDLGRKKTKAWGLNTEHRKMTRIGQAEDNKTARASQHEPIKTAPSRVSKAETYINARVSLPDRKKITRTSHAEPRKTTMISQADSLKAHVSIAESKKTTPSSNPEPGKNTNVSNNLDSRDPEGNNINMSNRERNIWSFRRNNAVDANDSGMSGMSWRSGNTSTSEEFSSFLFSKRESGRNKKGVAGINSTRSISSSNRSGDFLQGRSLDGNTEEEDRKLVYGSTCSQNGSGSSTRRDDNIAVQATVIRRRGQTSIPRPTPRVLEGAGNKLTGQARVSSRLPPLPVKSASDSSVRTPTRSVEARPSPTRPGLPQNTVKSNSVPHMRMTSRPTVARPSVKGSATLAPIVVKSKSDSNIQTGTLSK